jgi:excisionase family DNA binding protein
MDLLGSSEATGGVVTEPWLSADDIAARFGVTKDTIHTWVAEKRMPARKIGRLWKFQASEIDAWVRAHETAGLDRDKAGAR